MKAVRYYTTTVMNGGVTFKCVYCKHAVTTFDFESTRGNRRTQAAAAMNRHAAQVHLHRTFEPANVSNRGAW